MRLLVLSNRGPSVTQHPSAASISTLAAVWNRLQESGTASEQAASLRQMTQGYRILLFRRWGLHHSEEGQVENLSFSLSSVPLLAQSQWFPKFREKNSFLFLWVPKVCEWH